MERVQVVLGRVPHLIARQIEAHHSAVPVRHGQLGHLQAGHGVHASHGAQDDAPADAVRLAPPLQPLEHRLQHLIVGEAAAGVEERREARLRVHDAVAREVLDRLERDALQGLGVLHDGDREVEPLKVLLEVADVRTLVEAPLELLDVVGGQVDAVLAGEIDDGARAQSSVEMIVQQHFRHAPEDVARELHRILSGGGESLDVTIDGASGQGTAGRPGRRRSEDELRPSRARVHGGLEHLARDHRSDRPVERIRNDPIGGRLADARGQRSSTGSAEVGQGIDGFNLLGVGIAGTVTTPGSLADGSLTVLNGGVSNAGGGFSFEVGTTNGDGSVQGRGRYHGRHR